MVVVGLGVLGYIRWFDSRAYFLIQGVIIANVLYVTRHVFFPLVFWYRGKEEMMTVRGKEAMGVIC